MTARRLQDHDAPPDKSPVPAARRVYCFFSGVVSDRVFSSTLEEPLGWRNSTVLSEDAVTAIERLKRTTDVPMRSHGGISLNRALLAAGLVDRLEVIMFPAVSGRAGDAALFHGGAEFDPELIESTDCRGTAVGTVAPGSSGVFEFGNAVAVPR